MAQVRKEGRSYWEGERERMRERGEREEGGGRNERERLQEIGPYIEKERRLIN